MNTDYRLEMIGITKDYADNRVLEDVELVVGKGEIHALMGENGAGKSTLMNILFGMPVIHSTGGFKGTIKIDGEEVKINSPQKALELGIGMVHQEFMLIPGFTVTENIKVGREITRPTVASKLTHKILGPGLEKLDLDAMTKDARLALDTIGLKISEDARVAGMPVGYMQFVEIAREIDKTGIRLLIFDEPTAVLTESEADTLLDIMRSIAAKGISIIFITHRLDEVINVTDNLTVLRDGHFVERVATKDTTAEKISQLMVGRAVEKLVDDSEETRNLNDDDIVLSFVDYEVDMPGEAAKGVNLNVRRGEILGIGGLAGQGKIGIGSGLQGLYESRGKVIFDGKELNLKHLGEALKNGIAFVSEDRKGVGLLLDEPIEDNIVFSAMQINGDYLKKIGPFSQYDSKAVREHAEQMIKELDIRCTGPQQPAGRLSGGNQQKVCVARALALNPKLLVVAEPTRGIDIGAKKLVLELLAKLNREQGMTVVVISSELNELRSISDRIAIITEGKVAGILDPHDDDYKFGLLMSGM